MSVTCMIFFFSIDVEHACPDWVKNRADMGFQMTARFGMAGINSDRRHLVVGTRSNAESVWRM